MEEEHLFLRARATCSYEIKSAPLIMRLQNSEENLRKRKRLLMILSQEFFLSAEWQNPEVTCKKISCRVAQFRYSR